MTYEQEMAIKAFEKELSLLCEKFNVEQYVEYNKYACEDVILTRIRSDEE